MSRKPHSALDAAVPVLAFVLAACSIVYELLIAKTIAKLCGDTMLWESLSIGVFVLGMGIGATSRFPSSLQDRLLRFARIELVLTLIGGASTAVILYLHMAYRIYGYDEGLLRSQLPIPPVFIFGVIAQLTTLMVGTLTGAELPLLLSFAADRQRSESGVLAAYYFGTLAGTLATPWLVLSHPDVVRVATGVAALNLLAAGAIFRVGSARFSMARRLPGIAQSVAIAVALAALAYASPRLIDMHLGNFYYNRYAWSGSSDGQVQTFFPVGLRQLESFLADYPKVQRIQSPYQQIDLVPEGPSPLASEVRPLSSMNSFALFIDGRFQISTDTVADYHETLAHVPIMTRPTPPKRVLVLGAGDGVLVKELLRYGEAIESITMIEFDEAMLKLARENDSLKSLNGDSLGNGSKVRVVVEDAFRYLRETTERFDAVYMDLTFPFEFESARLYSAEFLGLAARTLDDEGFLVLPSPIDLVDGEGSEFEPIVFSTLYAAGYRRMIAYHGERDAFILTAKTPEALHLDASQPTFPLASITAPFFSDKNHRELVGSFEPSDVHTLLKPKLIRMEDTFF